MEDMTAAKYIIYNSEMKCYGYGYKGNKIVEEKESATRYLTIGEAMGVAVKLMENYDSKEFRVKSEIEETPQQNELKGLFRVREDKVECIFVTPYQAIVDDYIAKHNEDGGELFVRNVPYLVD